MSTKIKTDVRTRIVVVLSRSDLAIVDDVAFKAKVTREEALRQLLCCG